MENLQNDIASSGNGINTATPRKTGILAPILNVAGYMLTNVRGRRKNSTIEKADSQEHTRHVLDTHPTSAAEAANIEQKGKKEIQKLDADRRKAYSVRETTVVAKQPENLISNLQAIIASDDRVQRAELASPSSTFDRMPLEETLADFESIRSWSPTKIQSLRSFLSSCPGNSLNSIESNLSTLQPADTRPYIKLKQLVQSAKPSSYNNDIPVKFDQSPSLQLMSHRHNSPSTSHVARASQRFLLIQNGDPRLLLESATDGGFHQIGPEPNVLTSTNISRGKRLRMESPTTLDDMGGSIAGRAGDPKRHRRVASPSVPLLHQGNAGLLESSSYQPRSTADATHRIQESLRFLTEELQPSRDSPSSSSPEPSAQAGKPGHTPFPKAGIPPLSRLDLTPDPSRRVIALEPATSNRSPVSPVFAILGPSLTTPPTPRPTWPASPHPSHVPKLNPEGQRHHDSLGLSTPQDYSTSSLGKSAHSWAAPGHSPKLYFPEGPTPQNQAPTSLGRIAPGWSAQGYPPTPYTATGSTPLDGPSSSLGIPPLTWSAQGHPPTPYTATGSPLPDGPSSSLGISPLSWAAHGHPPTPFTLTRPSATTPERFASPIPFLSPSCPPLSASSQPATPSFSFSQPQASISAVSKDPIKLQRYPNGVEATNHSPNNSTIQTGQRSLFTPTAPFVASTSVTSASSNRLQPGGHASSSRSGAGAVTNGSTPTFSFFSSSRQHSTEITTASPSSVGTALAQKSSAAEGVKIPSISPFNTPSSFLFPSAQNGSLPSPLPFLAPTPK